MAQEAPSALTRAADVSARPLCWWPGMAPSGPDLRAGLPPSQAAARRPPGQSCWPSSWLSAMSQGVSGMLLTTNPC
eukprot:1590510-Pyramimonas_sp.AAC.1